MNKAYAVILLIISNVVYSQVSSEPDGCTATYDASENRLRIPCLNVIFTENTVFEYEVVLKEIRNNYSFELEGAMLKRKLMEDGVNCLNESNISAQICNPSDNAVETRIDRFIHSFQFPKEQPVEILLKVLDEQLVVFSIEYGLPQDCPSGCFYSSGEGILYGDKIGWISLFDYDGTTIPQDSFYDLASTDEYLFTDEFYTQLVGSHGWVDHQAFMQLLAESESTPRDILVRYTNLLVTKRGYGWLSVTLVNNLKIRKDRELLQLIASLPVGRPEYREARAEAIRLLETLNLDAE